MKQIIVFKQKMLALIFALNFSANKIYVTHKDHTSTLIYFSYEDKQSLQIITLS